MRVRESQEIKQKLEYLFYEVLITCKELFVIAEFRNLLSYMNKRPNRLESLARSVFKMHLHPEDSDPSWQAVSFWKGRGQDPESASSQTHFPAHGQRTPLGAEGDFEVQRSLGWGKGMTVEKRMRIYYQDLWGVSYKSPKLTLNTYEILCCHPLS